MAKAITNADIFKLSTGLRCKPGDLAIVIKGKRPENLGAIVQVIRRSTGIGAAHGYQWEVETQGRKLTGKDLETGRETCFTLTNMLDEQLLPIAGLPIDEATTADAGVTT